NSSPSDTNSRYFSVWTAATSSVSESGCSLWNKTSSCMVNYLSSLLGIGVQVGHIQDDADVAVAQNGTAGDPAGLDVEAVQIGGQRLYRHLLLAQQLIHKQ